MRLLNYLSPSTAYPLPNGLSFGLVPGTFNQYEISRVMDQNVLFSTAWAVTFDTFGAGCSNVSQTITFNIEPDPNAILASAGTGDRTLCASETIIPIRYDVYNPALPFQYHGM